MSPRQVADVRQQHLPGPALPRLTMPTLEAFFHYRNLDVSTLKELARRWKPEHPGRLQEGAGAHGARRHRGVDRRTRVLPGASAERLSCGHCAQPQQDEVQSTALARGNPVRIESQAFAGFRGDSFIPSDRHRSGASPDAAGDSSRGMVGGDAVALTVPDPQVPDRVPVGPSPQRLSVAHRAPTVLSRAPRASGGARVRRKRRS